MGNKLMVLSAVHALGGPRKHVYKFFLRRMSHIYDKYGVQTLVVGSDGELSQKMTEDAGLLYVEHKNNPVSRKWDAGMLALKEHGPDYVMIMGSDDFMSDSLIEGYLDEISRGEYNIIGITDSYYCSVNLGRAHVGMCLYWPGYPKRSIIGYAKCMSSEIMDAVDWQPWIGDRNAGLDFHSNKVIKMSGVRQKEKKFSIKEEGWFHMDMKSSGNISSIAPIVRRSGAENGGEMNLDIRELLNTHLPVGEAEDISNFFYGEIDRYKKTKQKIFT